MNNQVAALLQMLKAATPPDAPRLWQLSPADARAQSNRFFAPLNLGGPAVAENREIAIPGRRGDVRARLYVPERADALSPGLLFLHGGGFVIGNPETHDRLARELAHGTGMRVISLDYALAPEHPFPAGLDDCVDAARWLGENGRRLGIDPRRLVIGGDSAGANLSAATALRLRDEGRGPALAAALLIYGRFAEGDTPSIVAWGDRDLVLSRTVMDWFDAHYTGGRVRPGDPYLSPLVAGDLSRFPPAVLVCGTLDPLLSDSQLFAAALEKAGVPVELHVYDDGIHAFVQMPMLDMAGDAIGKLCTFAQRACA
jgi:acetyl esterase